MVIIGVDPGPEDSSVVAWDGQNIGGYGEYVNTELASVIAQIWGNDVFAPAPGKIAIEQIRGFGVPAGNKLFDTCYWVGRFVERLGEENCILIPRHDIKKHLMAQNDRFVREALIARLGPPGTKKQPGVTYGISSHCWAALAVAVTAFDKHPSAGL